MTALFVTNYEMTMGAVITLNEEGIRVPDQISLVGFDNVEFARACNPALTIVTQPVRKIGQEAAEVMLSRLSGNGQEGQIIRKLETTIVTGKSVTTPRRNLV